jgi:hypothetical protein
MVVETRCECDSYRLCETVQVLGLCCVVSILISVHLDYTLSLYQFALFLIPDMHAP